MKEAEAERISAFQRLADQRLDGSYALATAILRDDSDAQDAVHDAVVLAWKRWASLRDRTKFDAWFDRIVVNVCRDRLKAARIRASADIEHAASIGTPDATSAVHHRIVVGQALERMKPDDIVVLTLRHFLDLQLEDIALLLDVPLPTAKTRLRTARERLRDRLERDARGGVTT
jgi:RNA polymerase sigma-70 factor (ECF subfamily)